MTMAPNETSAEDAPRPLDNVVQGQPVSRPSGSYTQHPLSARFPKLSDVEFVALVEDIQVHDQRVPITLYEGQVLDGWHRYLACLELGLPPRTDEFTGTIEEAQALAFSLNARRRHLNTGQLALLTAELLLPDFEAQALGRQRAGKTVVREDLSATWRTGRRQKQPAAVDAAKAVGVSPRSVERAKYVLTHGTAEEVDAVRSGSRKLGAVADAVQQRMNATETRAAKPSPTKATPTRSTTTTTALMLIPEPAALTLPDSGTIAALKSLNEDLQKHIAAWAGDPEFLIGTLLTWGLVARGHFGPHDPRAIRYTPPFDIETFVVGLPSEPMG
jgi:hypothetical protein